MFAIVNSLAFCLSQRPRWYSLALGCFLGCSVLSGACGEQLPKSGAALRAFNRAQLRFCAAQQQFANEPTNTAAAWEFARAGFERAEFSTNNAERAALSVQGIDACRQALARDAKLAPAHFYLGMNLGQLARTKLLGALMLVGEMERAFTTAATFDERFAHAGPNRCLGLLYYKAPALGSVGSRTKARKHFERAAEISPEFPENRLNLAEAYLKWREKQPLQSELDALEKLWPAAKQNLAGPDWEAEWLEWDQRVKELREHARDLIPPLEAPKGR